ncbi:hypothetical protein FZEAL_2648 [Fusarium zealandicum]|uniref:NAD(P)-binding domain-containing protein n=1 Tax=Fusarium zealandicum TaxID=1053134 RepID=A0A8H4UR50_9HYPO|nr:hypothetical protein FZEAL_2648 [Fusarium zealandicum]
MPSHITVVPASTKAGRETIRVLLASDSKPVVRGIYRDPSKAPVDFINSSNFDAIKGDVGSGSDLDFNGSDAVFYIPPPIYDGTDQGEWATQTATNVKKALQEANVKRLLILSAIGSQNDHGIGVLRINYISDTILKEAAPEVLIVRPSYFQEDFTSLLEDAKKDPPVVQSWITPIDHTIPMVSLKDIGKHCASSLLSKSTKPSPHYTKLFGPRFYGALDLKKAVEEVTGKEVELKLVENDQLANFFAELLPEAYVQEFVDMTTGGLPGGIIAKNFVYDDDTIKGQVELVDTLRESYTK